MPVINSPESALIKTLSEYEKQLGIDLKLTADGDLEFNNLNDVKLVAGAANAAQAVKLKLFIEPGGLVYHPYIGANLQIGEKISSAAEIKANILRSLLQDPRFNDVSVSVQIEGSLVYVDLRVTLINSDLQIPLQFTVDRG